MVVDSLKAEMVNIKVFQNFLAAYVLHIYSVRRNPLPLSNQTKLKGRTFKDKFFIRVKSYKIFQMAASFPFIFQRDLWILIRKGEHTYIHVDIYFSKFFAITRTVTSRFHDTGACLNGGDCVNVTGIAGVLTNFDCDCAAGWTGNNCELGRVFFTFSTLRYNHETGFIPEICLKLPTCYLLQKHADFTSE